MEPEEVAKLGNTLVAEMCEKMNEQLGEGVDYHRCAAAAATTLLFHVMRLGLHKSKAASVQIISAILQDVAENLKQTNGIQLHVEVRAR